MQVSDTRREDGGTSFGHERLCLLWVCELRIGDHAESGLSALEPAELNLDGDGDFRRSLDMRASEFDILFVGLLK